MEFDFKNFFSIFNKYKIEVFLIVSALIISIISIAIYVKTSTDSEIEIIENKNRNTVKKVQNIMVDVSGAVNKPGVYEFKFGSRINDAVKKAAGLSEEADKSYFSRNFNLSSYLFDQEKIHIPYIWEITSGIFTEEQRILNYLSPFVINSEQQALTYYDSNKININSASSKELEELPGIGQKTAQKIIENRPFSSIEDLLIKKILNQNVYENIKDQIIAK